MRISGRRGGGLTREGVTNAKEMRESAEMREDLFKNKKREKGASCGRGQRRGHGRQMCAPTSPPLRPPPGSAPRPRQRGSVPGLGREAAELRPDVPTAFGQVSGESRPPGTALPLARSVPLSEAAT